MTEPDTVTDRRWPRARKFQAVAALLCATVAAIFLFIGDGTGYHTGERHADGWRGFVLSWFHLIAWIFAATAFALAATHRVPRVITRIVALASLASYVVFRAVLHHLL